MSTSERVKIDVHSSSLATHAFHTQVWEDHFDTLERAVEKIVRDNDIRWQDLPHFLHKQGISEILGMYAFDTLALEPPVTSRSREQFKTNTLKLGTGIEYGLEEGELIDTPRTTKIDALAPWKILDVANMNPIVNFDLDADKIGQIDTDFFDKLGKYADLRIGIELSLREYSNLNKNTLDTYAEINESIDVNIVVSFGEYKSPNQRQTVFECRCGSECSSRDQLTEHYVRVHNEFREVARRLAKGTNAIRSSLTVSTTPIR